MALKREPAEKSERKRHKVTPIHGEFGRYTVDSFSAAKDGQDEAYIVDVLAEEHTDSHGMVTGTCPCKGWSVRKTCSHLTDALEVHASLVARKAEEMGFEKKD